MYADGHSESKKHMQSAQQHMQDAVAHLTEAANGPSIDSLDPALAEDVHAFNILTDLYEGLVAESATGAG